MPPAADRVRAIGRLAPGGPWIGFAATPSGHRLVVGEPDGSTRVLPAGDQATRAGLAAAASAYFLASLPPPPPDLEATHADVAGLVTSLARSRPPDEDPAVTVEVIDAIDDGLPGDAVALRLAALLPPGADPVALLVELATGAEPR
jgi:hypothetical protein